MIAPAARSGLGAALFSSLTGAGHGLIAWSGLTIALLALRGGLSPALGGVQLAGLALGLLLSGIGIARAVVGPGGPRDAWRTLARLRTSWPARELALALATTLLAAVAITLLLWMPDSASRAAWLACLGLPLAALALVTMACAAITWITLAPASTRQHPLALPGYLLLSLLTGLALQLVTMAAMLPGQDPVGMLPTLAMLGLVLAVLKWLHWRGIDTAPAPAADNPDMATAQAGPALARRHEHRLRLATVAGLVATPVLASGLMILGWLPALPATTLAALGLLAGAFTERWLFLAYVQSATGA